MEMQKSYKLELAGVFGYPVAENPTVVMMEAAFRAEELPWRYLTLEVRPEDLEAGIRGIRAMGFRGLNLTIPHKGAVLAFLDDVAQDARIMGAVNTIYREGDRLLGANTDGKGFLRALRDDAGMEPAGRRFLILGAGGAARAVAVELAMNGAAEVLIANRSEERGRALESLLRDHTDVRTEYLPWDHEIGVPDRIDALVNATSIGLYPNTAACPPVRWDTVRPGMAVCDVIPNPPRTLFLERAASRGALTLDGLGMLVYQGAIAFRLWTGREAPVEVMKRALAAEFGV